MLKTKKIKIVHLFFYMSVGVCALLFLYNWIVVSQIASRLEVSPNWDAIRNKLFKEFKPGMTREEVHDILDKVGPWVIDYSDSPDRRIWDSNTEQYIFTENIHFTEIHSYTFLWLWDFLYNKNGELIRWEPEDKT
jgi:hypothetical protein